MSSPPTTTSGLPARSSAVKAPTIEMIDNSERSTSSCLVIFGRDDNDLLPGGEGDCSRAIFLFPRQPASPWTASKPCSRLSAFDAPNWVRTDVRSPLTELKTYEQHCQPAACAGCPSPWRLNLPPALSACGQRHHMDLKYATPCRR
ncbi:cellulose biosynthesis cyclic di-GMP-binding regulatory protein BcsB [Klebsiella pneumoniae]|nr:cellulose biosynthesis cyclic di-GMP-binding regulatory protein BcsB [Klebsiella pneumoniae]